MASAEPAGLDQLLAWAGDPSSLSQFSPLFGGSLICFRPEGSDKLGEEARAQVIRWLRGLPCPSVAVGGGSSPLHAAADIVVEDAASTTLLQENSRRNPLAAAVLMQVLRLTESLPIADALNAESLAYSTLQSGPEFRAWAANHRNRPAVEATDHGPAVIMSRDGDQLILELNRPSNRNAMSVEMRDALIECLQLVIADRSIRAVRLSGRGRCFSTGGDLTEFGTAPDPATAHLVRNLTVPGRLLAECAQRVEVHLHGACIGSGIEFPAFAGRVIASADAHFQLPELRFGLIPGAGGCASIARRIGRQRTAWLALSGKRIAAPLARAWGLIDQIVD